jgi:hypothetical protein
VPAESLVPESVLGGLPVYPPPSSLTPEEAVAIVAQGRAVAEELIASGVIALALMEVGTEYFLGGPAYLSLKSIMSLEA